MFYRTILGWFSRIVPASLRSFYSCCATFAPFGPLLGLKKKKVKTVPNPP